MTMRRATFLNQRHLGWMAISAIVCASALAQDANQTYTPEQFFSTTSYSGLSWSPDGKSLLVSHDGSGTFNCYTIDAATGDESHMTDSTTDAEFAVGYFPQDGRVLYTADNGGDELNHLIVREVDGTIRDLTPGENLKAMFVAFANDGAELFVSTNERDARFFDLYRHDTKGYERELAFKNEEGFIVSAVSRDGHWAALLKVRTNSDNNIYLVDLSSDSEPKLITGHEGNIAHVIQEFNPDSTALLFTSNEGSEFARLWTHDLATGSREIIFQTNWDVMYARHSDAGEHLTIGVNEDASTKVFIKAAKTGKRIIIPDLPDGDLLNIRYTRDDSKVAFYLKSDTSPSNLYTFDLANKSVRRLTDALGNDIDEDVLVQSQNIRYPSFDGLEIPALLYKPKWATEQSRAPALVWVHGGPGGQSRVGYSAIIQLLVNHGYAVLAVNNRGSSGYGQTFYHMDDLKHGEVDLDDCVWAKKYLEDLEWVDRDRIGIMGGSYGGYMVCAALAFRPEEFDVGVDVFGVTNWERTLQSIPPWWTSFREGLFAEMGDPSTDAERHHRISPLFHAHRVTKPLLVIQGANDPRVLQVESDELVEAVRKNGVPVEYIIFDDEGHGFRSKKNRITAGEAYVSFLDRYLKGKND